MLLNGLSHINWKLRSAVGAQFVPHLRIKGRRVRFGHKSVKVIEQAESVQIQRFPAKTGLNAPKEKLVAFVHGNIHFRSRPLVMIIEQSEKQRHAKQGVQLKLGLDTFSRTAEFGFGPFVIDMRPFIHLEHACPAFPNGRNVGIDLNKASLLKGQKRRQCFFDGSKEMIDKPVLMVNVQDCHKRPQEFDLPVRGRHILSQIQPLIQRLSKHPLDPVCVTQLRRVGRVFNSVFQIRFPHAVQFSGQLPGEPAGINHSPEFSFLVPEKIHKTGQSSSGSGCRILRHCDHAAQRRSR